MPPRHIVLDIGRVLLVWDPEIPYRRLIPDAAERRRFLTEICSPEWNHAQDAGRSFAEGEAELIARHPHHEALIRAFLRHWPEMVPREMPETPAIMNALIQAGHDVTLLTNFSVETWPLAQAKFPLLSRARGVTVSGALGVAKPERAIFDHHARTFGLDPSSILFFDDSPTNVAGAEAAGWTARLFTDAAQMRADLAEAGIRLG
jgi:2-haloacid dehalogenase